MNIFDNCKSVLIIGNGFDKNCGLKTGFLNVYDEYIKSPSKSSIIKTFKDDINSDRDEWADFEFRMSEYAKQFDNEDGFIECLDDFSTFMHDYLIKEQRTFLTEWDKLRVNTNTIRSFTNSINHLGIGVTHNINSLLIHDFANDVTNIGYISLNYTRILDTLLDEAFGKDNYRDIHHVHGVLGDDPILGMDREEQLDLPYSVTDRLKRHFIKPYFINEYDKQRILDAENLITFANYIFVYGASLDESDLSWRERLIRWLCNNENHHLFIYFHRNEEIDTTSKPYVLDCEIAEKNRLISEWRLTEEFPVDRLHIPCGVKLFDLKKAIEYDKTRSAKKI